VLCVEITLHTAREPYRNIPWMRRFRGRDVERETQTFRTAPSTICLIAHTEDWSVVDVAVRKGQQRFDRRVKELSNPCLLLRTFRCCSWCLYKRCHYEVLTPVW